MKRTIAVGIAVMALLATACGSDGTVPAISNARIGQPTGPNAALYFTASGYGTDDSLVSSQTRVATSVEIHETTMNDDGTMGMRPVTSLDLPADGELVLEPGGFHLMLVGVDTLDVGDEVDILLSWEMAGNQSIQAVVVDPGETPGMDG